MPCAACHRSAVASAERHCPAWSPGQDKPRSLRRSGQGATNRATNRAALEWGDRCHGRTLRPSLAPDPAHWRAALSRGSEEGRPVRRLGKAPPGPGGPHRHAAGHQYAIGLGRDRQRQSGLSITDDPLEVAKILRHLGAWRDPPAGTRSADRPDAPGPCTYEPFADVDPMPDAENVLTNHQFPRRWLAVYQLTPWTAAGAYSFQQYENLPLPPRITPRPPGRCRRQRRLRAHNRTWLAQCNTGYRRS